MKTPVSKLDYILLSQKRHNLLVPAGLRLRATPGWFRAYEGQDQDIKAEIDVTRAKNVEDLLLRRTAATNLCEHILYIHSPFVVC